jgi:hypothetical protein
MKGLLLVEFRVLAFSNTLTLQYSSIPKWVAIAT